MTLSPPLLIGASNQVDPPAPTDPTFDFATGMPAGCTMTHNGVCLYRQSNGNFKQAAVDEPRLDYTLGGVFRGLLIERAIANKVTGNNLDNIPLAEWSNGQFFDDTTELAAAGLSAIVPSGQVLEGADTNVDNVGGQVGNLNPHSMCAFTRVSVPASEGRIVLTNGIGDSRYTNNAYEVARSNNFTPTATASRFRSGDLNGVQFSNKFIGATLVEDDVAPQYPIPGNAASFNGETLTIADAQVPDATYDVEITTEAQVVTLFDEVVAGDWTLNGATMRNLGGGPHVKKIVFKTPAGGPPPGPAQRRPFGVYGLNSGPTRGEFDQAYVNQIKGSCRGMCIFMPWFKIETARNVYDWTRIDDWISIAEDKTQELGHQVSIMFLPEQGNFWQETDPYVVGVPAYIVDNPNEFGGAPGGPGGMWPANTGGGRYKASKHHPAVMDRMEELCKRFIDRYGNNPTFMGIIFQETALGMTLSQTDFDQYGSGRGYLDRVKQRLTNLKNYGSPFAIAQNSNYYHYGVTGGEQQANYEVRRHCWELNQEIGEEVFHIAVPDSVGNQINQGYSSIYAGINQAWQEGYPGAWMPSIQWPQYQDVAAGDFTMQSCVDIAVTQFGGALPEGGGVMQWPRAANLNAGAGWDAVLAIYDSGPPYTTFRDRTS